MDIGKTLITVGTIIGYTFTVTGVNVLSKSYTNSMVKKNADAKISALSEEERTDENIANIISKESFKGNALSALITGAASVALGVASVNIISSTSDTPVVDTDGTDTTDTNDVEAALGMSNFYFNRFK